MNKTMIAATLLSLTLGACDTEEGRDTEIRQDRALTASAAALEIVNWAGAEFGSFVVGELFGLALPDEAVDLSQESLDEIRKIVSEEIQTGWFTNYSAQLETAASDFNDYFRAECASGITSSGDCSIANLNVKTTEAGEISDQAEGVYNAYVAWVTKGDGAPELTTDKDWQVFLSGPIRTALSIDLAMRRELFELENVKGNVQGLPAAWKAVTDAASKYEGVLGFIDGEYYKLKGQYGSVHRVQKEEFINGDDTNETIQYCFDAPGGLDCGDQKRERGCFGGFIGGCSSWEGPSEAELEQSAIQRKQDRMDAFEALAVGNESEFADMLSSISALAGKAYEAPSEDDPPPPPPPPPTEGSCESSCGGQSADGCWCDATCAQYGDCCSDLAEVCSSEQPAGSCEGSCGEQSSDGCWCDDFCAEYGDCCGDIGPVCG